LASSCHELQYAAVGGTYVTAVGAIALAERCTWAQERADTHVEKTAIRVDFALFNLALYRLAYDVDVASLSELFSRISILG
jgi:hypothetical protein